ncbi:MAG TPA: GNAT family N-acetyltransferase [Saprospiraceae bacterium]|nr:GNAT family N-acetyltransferase [Saprospiraceae bacterium]
MIIRPILPEDVPATLEIYKYYVENTSVTFDIEVPSLKEFLDKIEAIRHQFPWLLCLHDNKIIGYAHASKHRIKSAYKWSVESTVYVAQDFHRKGVASLLYESLFDSLRRQGFYNVYAGISLPNDSSEAFHKSIGFELVGTYIKIGYKQGEWHDVRWFQLALSEHNDDPKDPIFFNELK